MPIVRGQWAENLAPALVPMTVRGYDQMPEQYSRIVKVMNSDAAWVDDRPVDPSFGPLQPKGELETTLLDEPVKMPGKRIVHGTFALGYLISKEAMADDKVGLFTQLAPGLGRSSRMTAELYGHDVLNNAFSNSKYAGRDGLALFSTVHPLYGPNGGTVSNRPAVDTDISQAALEAALTAYRRQTDERGYPIQSVPKLLVITPEQEFIVQRLFGSTLEAGSNTNNVNVLRDRGLTIVIDDWLTDNDAWFMLGANHDIRFYWRQRMETYTWDDLNAGGTFHKVDQRHSTGFGDWRETYGSPGA